MFRSGASRIPFLVITLMVQLHSAQADQSQTATNTRVDRSHRSSELALTSPEWNRWKANLLDTISRHYEKVQSQKLISSISDDLSCTLTFILSDTQTVSCWRITRKSDNQIFDQLTIATVLSGSSNAGELKFPEKSGLQYVKCTVSIARSAGPSDLLLERTPKNFSPAVYYAAPIQPIHFHFPPDVIGSGMVSGAGK